MAFLTISLTFLSGLLSDDPSSQKIELIKSLFLSSLGKLSHIVAPNLYHYFFAAQFKAFYPNATFWAAPGLKTKQPELPIDRVIDSQTNNPWNGLETILFDGFRTLSLSGFDSLNECVFFHPASRTLILTDAAFHFDESFLMLTQFASSVTGGYKCLSPSLLEKMRRKKKRAGGNRLKRFYIGNLSG